MEYGRRLNSTVTVVIGTAALCLLIGGFFVELGQGFYVDDEAMWACPSGISGVQITESANRSLPAGIVECRSDSRRNLIVGLMLAGGGLTLATVAVVRSARLCARTAKPAVAAVDGYDARR